MNLEIHQFQVCHVIHPPSLSIFRLIQIINWMYKTKAVFLIFTCMIFQIWWSIDMKLFILVFMKGLKLQSFNCNKGRSHHIALRLFKLQSIILITCACHLVLHRFLQISISHNSANYIDFCSFVISCQHVDLTRQSRVISIIETLLGHRTLIFSMKRILTFNN